MPKPTHKLTYENCSLSVAIDHRILTNEKLHYLNGSFEESVTRLEDEDGDVLAAVLKHLFISVIEQSFSLEPEQLIEEWNIDPPKGWGLLQEYGIELIGFRKLEIDTLDIHIETLIKQHLFSPDEKDPLAR
jgi:hypothetical protein